MFDTPIVSSLGGAQTCEHHLTSALKPMELPFRCTRGCLVDWFGAGESTTGIGGWGAKHNGGIDGRYRTGLGWAEGWGPGSGFGPYRLVGRVGAHRARREAACTEGLLLLPPPLPDDACEAHVHGR